MRLKVIYAPAIIPIVLIVQDIRKCNKRESVPADRKSWPQKINYLAKASAVIFGLQDLWVLQKRSHSVAVSLSAYLNPHSSQAKTSFPSNDLTVTIPFLSRPVQLKLNYQGW